MSLACATPQCCARHPRACSHARPDEKAAKLLRSLASPAGDLAVSHTDSANLPFARNWWTHLRDVAGVRAFALLTTDANAWAALSSELPRHTVRCPPGVYSAQSDRHGSGPAQYRSARWTHLMFAVPRMVHWVASAGVNVLWMDTDVVALRDPMPILHAQLAALGASGRDATAGLVLASVDGRFPDEDPHECGRAYSESTRWGRSAGGGKLCGGLFYLRSGPGTLRFLRDWERRLRGPGAGAKNQPHYNEALRSASGTLQVEVMPCDLFPNGYRYNSAAWKAAQRRAPVVVHANWMKGAAVKQQRLQSWGLWRGSGTTWGANGSTSTVRTGLE